MKVASAPESLSVESLMTVVADEFLERLDRGEQPDVEEYAGRYPQIATFIRQMFPTLQLMRAPGPDVSLTGEAAEQARLQGCLGDYRILHELGRGGMGIVYEAEQISLSRRVALKVLPFAAALDAKQLQRFKNEAQAAAHLHHQHIVPVYGVGCERGVHYYAMQYIEGRTLAATIRELRQLAGKEDRGWRIEDRGSKRPEEGGTIQDRRPANETKRGSPLSSILYPLSSFFRTVAQLGVQAAEALEYAHSQGIIHRDVKPANLLVDAQSNLWITDFGLALCQGDAGLTLTGDVVGTLRYMSPEQAQGKRFLVDQHTDIYSLGVTLYEMLTLEPAFGGSDRQELLRQITSEEPQPPRQRISAIPAELETIVLKATAKGAEERYATALELADDLRRYLEDKPIRAKRPSLWQRAVKWSRRHKTVVRAAVVVLFLAMVALAVSTVLIWRAFERERQTSYYQRIALAQLEWSTNNLGRVEQLLEECPVDLRGWEWHYLKRLRYKTLSPLYHDSRVLCEAFNPTGQYLASGGRDGVIKLWDAHTGQPFRNFRAGEMMVFSVAFSPDGQHLAAACSDGSVKIWDIQGDNKLLDWKAHPGPVQCLVFSPDGDRLASSSVSYGWEGQPAAGEVKVWDAATGQEILTLGGQDCVAFSSDGRRLATGGPDRTVKVWDAMTGRKLLTCDGHTAAVHAVAFSPDGRSLASASANWNQLVHAEVKLWDARTGEPRLTLGGHIGYILSVAFSPDGQRLASAGMDRTVKLWDVATGRETLTLRGHRGGIYAVAFSPDGRQLASASGDHTVRVWDATPLEEKPGEESLTLRVHPAGVLGVAFHPDGQRLASVAADAVKLWDSHTGKALLTFPYSQDFWSVAISPDGQRLAAGGGQVKVWDVRTGQELCSLGGFSNIAYRVAFSPDSRHLLSAHWDRTVRLWDTATGHEVHRIPAAHAFAIRGLALSPNGKSVVTASVDETVKVWDVATGRPIITLQPPHPLCPICVAFRPDGQLLASASVDGTIKLWDTQTWKQGQVVSDPTGGVQSLAFSPNGRLLAWGSTDATVKVWDALTKEIQSLRGHTSWVEDVAFSPDGKWIASASLDGTVQLWPVPFVPEDGVPAPGLPVSPRRGQND